MDVAIAHLQEYWPIYLATSFVLIPFLYLTRRWSLPLIQWTAELAIYMGIFHVVVHYVVAVAAWFQFESQMKMLKDQRVATGWETPLKEFWDRALYTPQWIFYFEIVVALFMVYMMYRLRPMKTQRVLAKREQLRKGQAPQVRPPGLGAKSQGR